MRAKKIAGFLLLPILALTTGCIAPKRYRPVGQLTPLRVWQMPDATVPDSIARKEEPALPLGSICTVASGDQVHKLLTPAGPYVNGAYQDKGPCIAFVEYNKKGNRYNQEQIENAAQLVREAIEVDPQHQPIIVGFVHGWKHNANPGNARPEGPDADPAKPPDPESISTWPPEDDNIQGLEHVLNYLYRCYYAAPSIRSPCMEPERQEKLSLAPEVKGHVVVGIYFAWYGANISPYWPVAQQTTVYSRGGEADLVARQGDLSADLERLSLIAHPIPKVDKHEPMFVLVGHSFGARLLEQAIEGPIEVRTEQQIADRKGVVPTFADLVLYVNSAAPAIDGIDMLSFLADEKVEYRKSNGDAQPLVAAITTPADAATGIVFTIAMSPLSWSHSAPVKLNGFDPTTRSNFPITENGETLYRDTLGHLQEFQSHSVKDIGPIPKDTCAGSNKPGDFLDWVPGHCFEVKPAAPMTGSAYRWNGTPYWIMSTDQNLIPDHGTIFTNRLLRFVGHMLPDEISKAEVTGVPSKRLYTTQELTRMSSKQLDDLFSQSPPGIKPNGQAIGTAIIDPGTPLEPVLEQVIENSIWKGKTFNAASDTLINRITFGISAIEAKVEVGKSLFDKKDCIILDYSENLPPVRSVRDEIRQIGPSLYLGIVYWKKQRTPIYFVLDFSRATALAPIS